MTTYFKLTGTQKIRAIDLYSEIVSGDKYITLAVSPASFKRAYVDLARLAPELECKRVNSAVFAVKLNKIEIGG